MIAVAAFLALALSVHYLESKDADSRLVWVGMVLCILALFVLVRG